MKQMCDYDITSYQSIWKDDVLTWFWGELKCSHGLVLQVFNFHKLHSKLHFLDGIGSPWFIFKTVELRLILVFSGSVNFSLLILDYHTWKVGWGRTGNDRSLENLRKLLGFGLKNRRLILSKNLRRFEFCQQRCCALVFFK